MARCGKLLIKRQAGLSHEEPSAMLENCKVTGLNFAQLPKKHSQPRRQARCWAVVPDCQRGHDPEVSGPPWPCSGPPHLKAWSFCAPHLVTVTVSSLTVVQQLVDKLAQMQCTLLCPCQALQDLMTCHLLHGSRLVELHQ